MASRVLKRTALAFPVFRIERLAWVIPIFSASSPDVILRLASITSIFTIIDMAVRVLDGEVLLFLQLYGNVKEVAEEYDEYTENHVVHHNSVVGNHWGGCP